MCHNRRTLKYNIVGIAIMTSDNLDWEVVLDDLKEKYGSLENVDVKQEAEELGVSKRTLYRHLKEGGMKEKKKVIDIVVPDESELPEEIVEADPDKMNTGMMEKIALEEGYERGTDEFNSRVWAYKQYLSKKRERLRIEKNPLLKTYEGGKQQIMTVKKQVMEFLESAHMTLDDLVSTEVPKDAQTKEQEPVQLPQVGVITKMQAEKIIDEYGGMTLFANKEPNKNILGNLIRGYGWVLLDPDDPKTIREAAGRLGDVGYKVVNPSDKEDLTALLTYLFARGFRVFDTKKEGWIDDMVAELKRAKTSMLIVDKDKEGWLKELGVELKMYDKRITDDDTYQDDVERRAREVAQEGMNADAAKDFLEKNGYMVEKATLTRQELEEKLKEYRAKWEKEFDLKVASDTEIAKTKEFSNMVSQVVGNLVGSIFGSPVTPEEEKIVERISQQTEEDLRKAKEEWDARKKKGKKTKKKKGAK